MKIDQLISGLDEAKGSRLATARSRPTFRAPVQQPQEPTTPASTPNLTVVPGGRSEAGTTAPASPAAPAAPATSPTTDTARPDTIGAPPAADTSPPADTATPPTAATDPAGEPLTPDELRRLAGTNTDSASPAPQGSGAWDKTKAFGRGALNALRGTGNVASEIGQAVTAPIGSAVGGLVRGYQTARAGQPFSAGGRNPGFTGGVGSAGGGGGAGQDEVNQLRATIARLDQRLTRAGIAEKKKD